MGQFRLTLQAEGDLDRIGAYTLEKWGMDQAIRYLTELDQTFAALAQTTALGKDRTDLRPGLISCSCNRHMIFFRRSGQGDVEILRILHERMDFDRHL
ncbi:type II toxin-antitoxin system RelE/ParE family toxin [Pseudogemmobacter blasticus]|uniref:Toxin n=1 Tax=Fuscovulum blasticum DSM 2131 TaxID=1188250 RepID=A0A2T4J5Q5_FUSBL|nr:type II toxin-antitoxin system RelE/ParE family toxin [Fuscovulum blasticum]PTE13207.1 plasmid stabilization protein ParE [Fuscovulum blasticum DSM 2131]